MWLAGFYNSEQGLSMAPWPVRAWSPNHWTATEFPIVVI